MIPQAAPESLFQCSPYCDAVHWESEVLAHTEAERTVRRFAFYGKDAQLQHDVVVKSYYDDTGRRTCEAMLALSKACAIQADVLKVMPALFYDAERRLFVQERLHGAVYTDLVYKPDASRFMHRLGRAIADLHGLRVSVGETTGMREHLNELIRPTPAAFIAALPQYRARVNNIVDVLLAREAHHNFSYVSVPIHRDLHLRQAFDQGGQVYLIDWDFYARGDAALDLGNLLVYLETRFPDLSTKTKSDVVEGYLVKGSSSVLRRVYVYKALTYLRLACKHYRLQTEDWEQQTTAMLEKSEHCLTQENGDV
jgi:thiamine kinase-like enzyme